MEAATRWLVQQPLHIAGVGLALVLVWLLLRRLPSRARRSTGLLVAAVGWLAYAGWEWWVWAATPEANIRVDLLVIWPVLASLTL